jgi:hypothetical protein
MPISDDRLQSDVNAHILVPATSTVYEALQQWRSGHPRFGKGREWWWLIIEYDAGHYTAIAFEQLRELLMHEKFGVKHSTVLNTLPVAKDNPDDWAKPLPGVVAARVVEKNTLSTSAALRQAENSAGNLLVVIHQGNFVGIINKRMRNFAMANQSLLDLLEEMETTQPTGTLDTEN